MHAYSNFCGTCNRLRITADGKLKVCLFGEDGFNFKEAFKGEISLLFDVVFTYSLLFFLVGMNESEIVTELHKAIQKKKFALGGHDDAAHIASSGNNRPMILIGG
jgi:molybdenum cofactor biosynthesis enzyme MoaA